MVQILGITSGFPLNLQHLNKFYLQMKKATCLTTGRFFALKGDFLLVLCKINKIW